MRSKRLILLLLLAATALALRLRGSSDRVVPSVALDLLPKTTAGWRGTDVPLTREVRAVLGDGRFLSRTYRAPVTTSGPESPIDLLIAYYPSQRSGQSIHSPQNCLPGAGWTFASSGRIMLLDVSGRSHRVGEYLVTNGSTTLEVLYWYRSRGVDIASDYAAKSYLILQAVRDRRTDGALIRISTPLGRGEAQALARQRVVDFAASLNPLLPPFLPE